MATTEIKIAFIGGGSRDRVRKLMFDLALCPELGGQVALHDIDIEAAREMFVRMLRASRDFLPGWNLHELPDQPEMTDRISACPCLH
jgi:galacturan 1,4-alpha-galacturonidase